uniref:Uncharacterized protein n=1 Tax=Anguilla anguilla TaxID=7936 RepID=A0A0E9PVX4_ANGAN
MRNTFRKQVVKGFYREASASTSVDAGNLLFLSESPLPDLCFHSLKATQLDVSKVRSSQ